MKLGFTTPAKTDNPSDEDQPGWLARFSTLLQVVRALPNRVRRSETDHDQVVGEEEQPVSKVPPGLATFFFLSHIEDKAVVRLDEQKVGVLEVMGLELDLPALEGFAGALNALEFPIQILIRQHPPRMRVLRDALLEARPPDLTDQARSAADALERLLVTLEGRDGIMDRRFYAICALDHQGALQNLLASCGLRLRPLTGRNLRNMVLASALGGSPIERPDDEVFQVNMGRHEIAREDHVSRSIHLNQWPRTVSPGSLGRLMGTGVSMDISIHLSPIPSAQASRMLEWQKVRFESSRSLAFRKGRTVSAEANLALEDVLRLRDDLQRGRQRLFNSSLSVTVHGKDQETLNDQTQKVTSHFASSLGRTDPLAMRQRNGTLAAMPLCINFLGVWRTLDTITLATMFPFSPPDLDTRRGTLFGIDLRACSPVTFDPYDGTHMNSNVAILSRSGGGKTFGTKLWTLRSMTRGVVGYIIDPEGEYAEMAREVGGRVLTPGVEGQGMNPFIIDQTDDEEVLHRIGSLGKLIEVMVREPLGAERRGEADHALTTYYEAHRERRHGFQDFYDYLEEMGLHELRMLLRTFATGSLRHLLSDQGGDLLANEAPVTVFDLHLLAGELRPAAAMVCTETVWSLAALDPKPRTLVVDEVWSIMQHPEGAAFMVNLAKRARKHQLGLLSITQDVQDLLAEDSSRTITGHSGRVLLQNSAFKLLLQQDPAAIEAVGEAFDLSDDHKQWLMGCPRGVGLLIAEGNKFPVRIEAAPEEAKLLEWTPGPRQKQPDYSLIGR